MRPTLAWVLALVCLIPAGLMAETAHVVSSSELQLQAAKRSRERQESTLFEHSRHRVNHSWRRVRNSSALKWPFMVLQDALRGATGEAEAQL